MSDTCKHELLAASCAICHPHTGAYFASTYQWESHHPDVEVETLAQQWVDGLTDADARSLALRLMVEEFTHLRRRRIRVAEERAASEARAQERAIENQHAEKFYGNAPWAASSRTTIGRAWRRLSPDEQVARRAALDAEFAQFVKEEMDSDEPAFHESSFADWRLRKAFSNFRAATRQEVILELTNDLLSATFALGDGSTVTWGEATADQHEQRFNLLLSQAGGTVRAAQRHQAAIGMLGQHRARTLSEVAERLTAATA